MSAHWLIKVIRGLHRPKYFCIPINPGTVGVLILLIAVSLVVAICFLAAFIWSVKKGQYDDSYTPSVRILLDDIQTDTDENRT
jgi:cbb3-type cytochrome oxidase maturation protein